MKDGEMMPMDKDMMIPTCEKVMSMAPSWMKDGNRRR